MLHKSVFHGRRPRKKPFISKENKAKRINYVKICENKAINFWGNVQFPDESKFDVFGGKKNSKKIWREKKLAEQNSPVYS